MLSLTLLRHRLNARTGTLAVVLLLGAAFAGWHFSGTTSTPGNGGRYDSALPAPASGPPWIYGQQPGARFVITFYADLECPHCKSYFPMLRSWIDLHPRVELRWHHLPLAFHEPAATRLAVAAECIGEIGGHAAFWDTVAWIFLHTNGDGRGLPDSAAIPGMAPAVEACIGSERPKDIVREHVRLATEEGIDATPTLKLEDRTTGKQLVLAGAVEDDALLSALDLVSNDDESESGYVPHHDLPAGVAGMPR